MENDNKKTERIEELKKEIDEYHNLAQIQNKTFIDRGKFSSIFHSINSKVMIIWMFIIFALFFYNFQYPIFPESFGIKSILIVAFGGSIILYIFLIGISLFITSVKIPSSDPEIKKRLKFFCMGLWLIGIMLIGLVYQFCNIKSP